MSALFSALEVVPLTLITLDARDFVRLSRPRSDATGERVEGPHKWTFYFLMAVGFWNFVGAGIFGFLINLPIVSYFDVGTLLTANHAHAAMMGVFGMLGIGLAVFVIRQTVSETLWRVLEEYVRVGFWGLNGGLMMMVPMSLFPAGVLHRIGARDYSRLTGHAAHWPPRRIPDRRRLWLGRRRDFDPGDRLVALLAIVFRHPDPRRVPRWARRSRRSSASSPKRSPAGNRRQKSKLVPVR